jgi:hypothetical protein
MRIFETKSLKNKNETSFSAKMKIKIEEKKYNYLEKC